VIVFVQNFVLFRAVLHYSVQLGETISVERPSLAGEGRGKREKEEEREE
jgi:hypothetical protein